MARHLVLLGVVAMLVGGGLVALAWPALVSVLAFDTVALEYALEDEAALPPDMGNSPLREGDAPAASAAALSGWAPLSLLAGIVLLVGGGALIGVNGRAAHDELQRTPTRRRRDTAKCPVRQKRHHVLRGGPEQGD
jgi:hypothetical protein